MDRLAEGAGEVNLACHRINGIFGNLPSLDEVVGGEIDLPIPVAGSVDIGAVAPTNLDVTRIITADDVGTILELVEEVLKDRLGIALTTPSRVAQLAHPRPTAAAPVVGVVAVVVVAEPSAELAHDRLL